MKNKQNVMLQYEELLDSIYKKLDQFKHLIDSSKYEKFINTAPEDYQNMLYPTFESFLDGLKDMYYSR